MLVKTKEVIVDVCSKHVDHPALTINNTEQHVDSSGCDHHIHLKN